MSRKALERAVWRVTIPAHTIKRTGLGGVETGEVYELPERISVRYEVSESAAIEFAVQALHIEHDVPRWSPYFEQSVRQASAERTTVMR